MVEVFGEVRDCVKVVFCVGIGSGESFSLTNYYCLVGTGGGGWEEEKWRYWNVLVFLKNVLMSSRFLVWNLFPLWIVRSRKSTEVVLISCVNLIVG